MRISDIRVDAIEIAMANPDVVGIWTRQSGERAHFRIGPLDELTPLIDELRAELRDPMSISSGRTPKLRAFAEEWGQKFLPPTFADDIPDVLVIISHGQSHDLPFHLIRIALPGGNDRPPLGVLSGVTYAGSRSLFIRNVERNPLRQRNLSEWTFDEADAASKPPVSRSFMAGGVDVLADMDEQFREICQRLAEKFEGERVLFTDPRYPFSRTAIKAAFRREPSPSVVCVVAHGWVDEKNHRMSGLLLARDQFGLALRAIPLHGGRYFDFRDLPLRRLPGQLTTTRETEVFTAAELEVDAEIDCELVMLLGCSAGWGRVLQGDEPASLAETWLKIGAASVVAPMWDAPLQAVRVWSDEYLDGWTRLGMPKALAMRHAMRQLYDGGLRDSPERLGVMILKGDWL